MTALYIASTETFSGKSALCVGLGLRLRRDGVRIGYMKPVSAGARLAAGLRDEDAEYFQQAFGLADALEDMVPVRIAEQAVHDILVGDAPGDFGAGLCAAYERIAAGCDLVLLEGACNLREGTLVGLPPARVADLLGAREVVVIRYEDLLQVMDDALESRAQMGESFAGVVVNSCPRPHMPQVQEELRPALEKRGIPVLAVLPLERLLQSISVAELTSFLSGEVLCGEEHLDELVEHLMVGAMGVDSALAYFRRKPNKAVITGGDRPDIQLAALETSTRCLVLTGNLRPSPIILARAVEVGVPMILVRHDTMAAVETVERYFGKTRFRQQRKIERFEEMLADRFDFGRLYAALGLKARGA